MDWNQTKPPLGSQINWAHPLSKGIVGCWLFNEGMGDKVYDLSGNGNTGTLTGFSHPATVTSGWNPGKFGRSINFNGSNNSIPTTNYQFGLNDFSLVCSFIANNTSSGILIAKSEGGANYQFRLMVLGGSAIFILSNSNNTDALYSGTYTLTAPVNINTLYQIVVTREGIKYKIYLNGVNKAVANTATIINHVNSNVFRIGSQSSVAAVFNGQINYVYRIHRCLTPQEVQQLYNSPFCFIN